MLKKDVMNGLEMEGDELIITWRAAPLVFDRTDDFQVRRPNRTELFCNGIRLVTQNVEFWHFPSIFVL